MSCPLRQVRRLSRGETPSRCHRRSCCSCWVDGAARVRGRRSRRQRDGGVAATGTGHHEVIVLPVGCHRVVDVRAWTWSQPSRSRWTSAGPACVGEGHGKRVADVSPLTSRWRRWSQSPCRGSLPASPVDTAVSATLLTRTSAMGSATDATAEAALLLPFEYSRPLGPLPSAV